MATKTVKSTAKTTSATTKTAKPAAKTTKKTTAKRPKTKKKLVIVESPSKAKTIGKYLGRTYKVVASLGHVRDLPKSRMGVDIENDYQPDYISIRGKGDVIKELRKDAKQAKAVYLASDPDREGEAIAWHVANLLKLDTKDKNPSMKLPKTPLRKPLRNRVRSTWTWLTRSRHGGFWIGWLVIPSARFFGKRSKKDCLPDGCSQSR